MCICQCVLVADCDAQITASKTKVNMVLQKEKTIQ